MNDKESTVRYNRCREMIDAGKLKEALTLAESISAPLLRAMIFIDGGTAIGRSGIVREGTRITEELLSLEQTEHRYARYSLLYNAANGHSSIYMLRRKRRKKIVPPNDENLRAAKFYYREALKDLEAMEGKFASQILVNYGNCLSQFGRHIEATMCYRQALDVEPENGMAAGNLAQELEYVAQIMGIYRHEYMALAYDLLLKAFSSEMHLDYGSLAAQMSFQATLTRLENFMDSHQEAIPPPKPYELSPIDKLKEDYVQFCFDRGLFLNAWVGDEKLVPAITDEISFGPIVTHVEDQSKVPELLRILNEIKESFATARYLFFLSQKESRLRNEISEMTYYFDSQDAFAINGLYTGLCKTAYSRAFDVLDKVARIINVYFGIGKGEDSYWSMLAEKQSLGEDHKIRFGARPAIRDADNYGMYALADLCIDYYESSHFDLKAIDTRRNKITHDYLLVRLHPADVEDQDNHEVSLDGLSAQTGEVLELVKHAIMYLVTAVNLAEIKEEPKGKVAEVQYFRSPGTRFM